jgi:predicted MFS family arabinose efflux permease
VNTANNVGASLGAVGAGALVDFASVSTSLVLGAGVLIAASILVIARRGSLRVPGVGSGLA